MGDNMVWRQKEKNRGSEMTELRPYFEAIQDARIEGR